MLQDNFLIDTDSYKHSHFLQYPTNVSGISFYIESRRNPFHNSSIVFFGLQMFLKKYLTGQVITQAMIDEAEPVVKAHGLPFNRAGFEYIVKQYEGRLPLEIQAVPEGSKLAPHDIQVQIRATDKNCIWLPGFIETALLRSVWYPSSVATLSHSGLGIIKKYLEKTADNILGLPFKLHDFGSRGTTSREQSGIGGAAHLLNFKGTDTMMGLAYARDYYGADMPGYSIPAAEHSTIITWGQDYEGAAFENMIHQFGGPNKLFAVVSDSYDIYNAVNKIWGEDLRGLIEGNGGCLVIRPDSGDPVTEPTKLILMLMEKFGYSINTKGYRLLPSCLRLIQGDGVNLHRIHDCLDYAESWKVSADNLAFGMGKELLQAVHRDTLSYAMKPSAVQRNSQSHWFGVSKSPVGAVGKKSREGRFINFDDQELGDVVKVTTPLEMVFYNGTLCRDETWETVVSRVQERI